MIISSPKYNVSESQQDYYTTHMFLTIRNFTLADATNYLCSASNSMGSSDATVTINASPKPRTQRPDVTTTTVRHALPTLAPTHNSYAPLPHNTIHTSDGNSHNMLNRN